MSLQTLAEPHREKMDSHQQFLQLYKSISDACKELVPLEKKVMGYEKKLKEGNISPFEAQLLKKDMGRVLELYDAIEKTSQSIRELRQLQPNDKENEVNAIIETKTYLCIEGMRTHSHMMGSKTSHERMEHTETMEGLSLAEKKITELVSEIGEDYETIKKDLLKHKLG